MGDRLFAFLLRLLPEEFRASYGPDMTAAFRAERATARARRRWGTLLRLWLATAADVLRHAPREHLAVLGRDLTFALRLMRARPAETTTAVVTLGIAIGANIAMFAVVDAVLFEPLPYRDAGRLVAVAETSRGEGSNLGYLTFVDLGDRARSFDTMAASSASFATLTGGGRDAERVNAMRASRTYFDMLGVRPALGRPFTEEEDRPGVARRVAILSDALWRRRFDADPTVVGRPIEVNGIPYVVVGVLPAGFRDLIAERMYAGAELWVPLGYDPAASFACRTCRHLRVFGRLAAGVSVVDAEREVGAIVAALEREHPSQYSQSGARLTRLTDVFLGPVRPVLLVLWAGVALLLVVACGHVANLLLLRSGERAHEWSVRTALGVTRRRLLRQLLTESLMLSAAAGTLGLGVSFVAVGLVRAASLPDLPRLATAAVDLRAVLVAVGVTMVSAVIFGLTPFRQLRRQSTAAAGDSRRATAAAGVWRTRSLLVAGNVAMATLLLVGSGLLVRSLTGLLAVSPGVDPDHVLTLQLSASGERFRAGETPDQIATASAFYGDVIGRLGTLPDVTGVAAVTTLPLARGVDGYGLHIDGRFEANPEAAPSAQRFVIAGDFFGVLRLPLRRGRLIDERDRQTAERVVVINETMAEELFGDVDPIGQRLRLGPQSADPRVIVGVVGDVRHLGPDVPAGYQVYVPQAQWAWAETALTVLVRTTGDPAALAGPVRATLRDIDPLQPVFAVRPFAEIVDGTTSTRRFAAELLSTFGFAALFLSVVGLYGALAVTVAQRQREIGIRLALGAPATSVRRLVLVQGLTPVALGLLAGLGLAALATSSLAALLFGISRHDPATYVLAALLVAGSALLSCLPPAFWASRVSPVTALRAP